MWEDDDMIYHLFWEQMETKLAEEDVALMDHLAWEPENLPAPIHV